MLEVKPLYTVEEFAKATQQSTRAMAGQLRARGVDLVRGHRLVFTLSDLQNRWPSLIESLQLAESARGWGDVEVG